MKRIIIIAALLVVVTAGGIFAWQHMGRRGSRELETWLGRLLVGVLQNYIEPEVQFASLDYEAPLTVHIEGLRLTDQGEPIISIDHARLELAEIPRVGQPVHINQINLQRPVLRFVQQTDGTFSGWTTFVKTAAINEPNSIPAGRRLSDILALRHATITAGQLQYNEADPESDTMVLTDVNLDVQTVPIDGEPGWYGLTGSAGRRPVFRLALDGRVNVDTAMLRVGLLSLEATLGEQQYEALPPRLQSFLRQRRARGTVKASLRGTLPLLSPHAARGNARVELTGFRLTNRQREWVVGDGTLEITSTDAQPPLAVGVIDARDSRLVHLPIVEDFVKLLAATALGMELPATDEARIAFTLHADRVHIDEADIISAVVALRGHGDVYFDGRLDLLVNAGALEKVQSELGLVGEAFGNLSDKLVRYHVSGTPEQPELKVRPLGVGG